LKKLASEHSALNKIKAEQIINYSALPFENEPSVISVAKSGSHEYKKLVKQER